MTPREREELETLLPWHAAGTLSPTDAARVEAALAVDPELARHFALVREEMSETIGLNEALGAPSTQTLDRLMAAIDAEPRRFPRATLGGWVARLLAATSPRTLAWVAAIAVLLIVLETGVLTTILLDQRTITYEAASVPAAPAATRGLAISSHVLIRFTPGATAAEITQFLQANKASVVDGPKPGGLYRLRVTVAGGDDLARTVQAMQGSKLVAFVGAE
jgi:hypothetical protein